MFYVDLNGTYVMKVETYIHMSNNIRRVSFYRRLNFCERLVRNETCERVFHDATTAFHPQNSTFPWVPLSFSQVFYRYCTCASILSSLFGRTRSPHHRHTYAVMPSDTERSHTILSSLSQHTLRQLKFILPGAAVTYYLDSHAAFWRIVQGAASTWGR